MQMQRRRTVKQGSSLNSNSAQTAHRTRPVHPHPSKRNRRAMPSPLSPPARSPRRPGRLRARSLLFAFAGASGHLAGAFQFHRGGSLVVGIGGVGGPPPLRPKPAAANANARPSFGPIRVPTPAYATSPNGGASDEAPSNNSRIGPALSFAAATAAAYACVSVVGGALFRGSAKAVAATASKAAKAAPEAVLPPVALPTVRTLAVACLLPTLLGYYKSEYGVSYGYGTAVAAASYLVLSSLAAAAGLPLFPALLPALRDSVTLARPLTRTSLSFHLAGVKASLQTTVRNLGTLLPASLPAFHATSVLFYGLRLDAFLLYRELFLPRFRAMRERIERRAQRQGGRFSRTPFLISCAFLYLCMACPLLVTARTCGGVGMGTEWGSMWKAMRPSDGPVPILEQSVRLSVILALAGFLLGALGDLNKTIGKALGGEDALVTWGVFRFLRHPNYTGEAIGWTASCLAGFLAVAREAARVGWAGGGRELWKGMAPYLAMSAMGAVGISFVLATATTGLEYRQKEKYGDTDQYKKWVKRSWVGFKMDPAQKDSGSGESVGESDK